MKGIKDILKAPYFWGKGLVTSTLNWLVTPFKHLYFWGAVLFFALAAVYSWFFWSKIWDSKTIETDLLEVFFLGLGGIMGLTALVLATFRQATLDRQTRTSQEQLFNERLGRGTELLANNKMGIRQAGIRVLDDLAQTAAIGQARLATEIIYDFIVSKSQKKYIAKAMLKNAKDRTKRMDVEFGIKVLFSNESIYRNSSSKNSLFFLSNLDLRNLNLPFMNFNNVVFDESSLKGTKFSLCKLENASFYKSNLSFSKLNNAILRESDFSYSDLHSANLNFADLSEIIFSNTDLSDASLHYAKNLTQDRLDNIVYDIKLEPKNLPSGLTLPKNRAYMIEKDENGKKVKRFVVSGELLLWGDEDESQEEEEMDEDFD